jgi:hypothetical protein
MYEIYVHERARRSARTLAFDATAKLRASGQFGRSCVRLSADTGISPVKPWPGVSPTPTVPLAIPVSNT